VGSLEVELETLGRTLVVEVVADTGVAVVVIMAAAVVQTPVVVVQVTSEGLLPMQSIKQTHTKQTTQTAHLRLRLPSLTGRLSQTLTALTNHQTMLEWAAEQAAHLATQEVRSLAMSCSSF